MLLFWRIWGSCEKQIKRHDKIDTAETEIRAETICQILYNIIYKINQLVKNYCDKQIIVTVIFQDKISNSFLNERNSSFLPS